MDQINETPPHVICDGEFKIFKITENFYSEVLEFYQNYFIPNEPISIATELTSSQESIDDMTLMCEAVLKDGVSFAARHCKTQKLVAICVNKMLSTSQNYRNYLEESYKKFKSKTMSAVGQYFRRMEETINIYSEWKIECNFEIFFVNTHPDYAKQGLGLKLSEYSLEYAQKLKDGSVAEEELPEHIRGLRPQAFTSLFTSRYSQRIGEKLGMVTIYELPHTEFSFNGKTFADILDPIEKVSVYAGLRL